MPDTRHREQPIPLPEAVEVGIDTATKVLRDAPVVIDVGAPANRAVDRAVHLDDLRAVRARLVERGTEVVGVIVRRVRAEISFVLVGARVADVNARSGGEIDRLLLDAQ